MKARGKMKTPSGGGSTLFSYFKPKTPSTSTCVSPTPSTNGTCNGKQQAAVTTPQDVSTNGKHVTPSRKRKNQEESKTPLTPCLPRAVLCEDDDSDQDIGARKVNDNDDDDVCLMNIIVNLFLMSRTSLEDQSAELQ